MTTVKISELPAILGSNTAAIDVVPIVDVSGNTTNKITRSEFFKNIQTDVEVADRITHVGDNSAVRFPALDTVSIETSGAERLRVNSAGNVGIGTSSPTERLDVNGNVVALNLLSGVYTPTLTPVANVTSSTAYVTQFLRVGSLVTVSGHIQITPTAANTDTRIRMTLPIDSNLGSQGVGGGGACLSAGLFGEPIGVTSDIVNDESDFRCRPTTTGARTYGFSFTYRIS